MHVLPTEALRTSLLHGLKLHCLNMLWQQDKSLQPHMEILWAMRHGAAIFSQMNSGQSLTALWLPARTIHQVLLGHARKVLKCSCMQCIPMDVGRVYVCASSCAALCCSRSACVQSSVKY